MVASATLLFASACRSNSSSTDDQASVQAWLTSYQKAVAAKDLNAVMAMYAPDVVAYDAVAPLQYVGTDDYRKDWQGFLNSFTGPVDLEFKDTHIQTSGDLAFFETLQHLTGTMTTGEKVDMWTRVTTGLRRVNGQWLDFHDHVSVPADLNTGKAILDLKP
jgi:ketosteroid isomerase-like protein